MTESFTNIRIKGDVIHNWTQEHGVKFHVSQNIEYPCVEDYLNHIAERIDDEEVFNEGELQLNDCYTITDLLKRLLLFDGIDFDRESVFDNENNFCRFIAENQAIINKKTTVKVYTAYHQFLDHIHIIERKKFKDDMVEAYSMELEDYDIELNLSASDEELFDEDPLKIFIPRIIDKVIRDNDCKMELFNERFPFNAE